MINGSMLIRTDNYLTYNINNHVKLSFTVMYYK